MSGLCQCYHYHFSFNQIFLDRLHNLYFYTTFHSPSIIFAYNLYFIPICYLSVVDGIVQWIMAEIRNVDARDVLLLSNSELVQKSR